MACVAEPEREAAVREVTQVYELIKLQQPLLLLHSQSQQQPPSTSTTTQLAHSLLGKALRALNVALSVIKQPVVKAEPPLSPPSRRLPMPKQPWHPEEEPKKRRRSSTVATEGKKKTSSSSWTMVTAVPYDDGYEWRKYGEKKINGTLFTRNYFRCSYKDDAGCLATKHVQQMEMDNNSDPTMFHVTYNNDHTCNSSAKPNTTGSSSSNLTKLLAGCCNMKQEPAGQHAAAAADMNMMKQEEPPLLLLPALVDLQQPSACFHHEQIPQCQEPLFHETMEQQFCGALREDDGEIPSATGSCISGETSWDGYRYSGNMAAAEDDPLHDLERFLFMDY